MGGGAAGGAPAADTRKQSTAELLRESGSTRTGSTELARTSRRRGRQAGSQNARLGLRGCSGNKWERAETAAGGRGKRVKLPPGDGPPPVDRPGWGSRGRLRRWNDREHPSSPTGDGGERASSSSSERENERPSFASRRRAYGRSARTICAEYLQRVHALSASAPTTWTMAGGLGMQPG